MKKIVIANWKMNPVSLTEAKKLFTETKRKAGALKKTQVVVCSPFVFLSSLIVKKNKKFFLGSQNSFWIPSGAYTGEVSSEMLKSLGVSHVIVGHSERRGMGETDEMVSKKIASLTKLQIVPVLCIGERERDTHGEYLAILSKQIKASLSGVQKKDVKNIVIAYEPIWAIGKTAEEAMNPHKLHEMVLYIRKVLTEIYGRDIAQSVQIIYGGSVESKNAQALMKDGNVSGFLVGHASLSAKGFGEIITAAEKS